MRYSAMVLIGLLVAGAADAAPDPTVHYSLKPLLTDGQLTAVEFEMRFQATQAQTEVDLPDQWGGGKDFYKALQGLDIFGGTSVSTPADQPSHRLIKAIPGAEIIIRFHLDPNRKAGEEAPIASNMTYPVIGPSRFHILGPQVWPIINSGGELPVTFAADMPVGWTLASNLQDLAINHGTDTDIQESVMLAGTDVHVETVATPNTRLRIATAGRFDFALADFDDRVSRVISTEQAFWGDGQPAFLVTLAPITRVADRKSTRGTGLRNAFALVAVPDTSIERLSVTLSHEYFHSWNIAKLGRFEAGSNEATGYWFSEGFTDYYGRKLGLKASVISLEQFVAEWNETLNRYAKSPHKTAPNADIKDTFWQDQDWQKMPYDRGSLLAVYLNAKWRPKNVTLDRFMHALRDKVAADPAFGAKPIEARVEAIATQLGVPVDNDLVRFIDEGDAIILPADAFGGCVQVVTEAVPNVDFGFDTKAYRDTNIFSGVKPDSSAYAAGLRDGMTFLGFKGTDTSDSSAPVTFDVRDLNGKTRSITYLPKGKTTYVRQRVTIPAGLTADQAKACASAITG